MMSLFISVIVILVGLTALIKNNINFNIRVQWIDEIFFDENWRELLVQFNVPYSYGRTFADLTLWRYISFKQYLKNKGVEIDE